jgi:hypothetical protein
MKKGTIVLIGSVVTVVTLLAAVGVFTLMHQAKPTPAYAAIGPSETPNFIQVGKVYSLPDPELQRLSILQIDKGGWVQIKTRDNEVMWLNLGVVRVMTEVAK